MAQTILMPRSTIPHYAPQSPDPTPLRLLAFSVAEAALQPDPNSPSFDSLNGNGVVASPPTLHGNGHAVPGVSGAEVVSASRVGISPPRPLKAEVRRTGEGRRMLNVMERAKERRMGENNPPAKIVRSAPSSPPCSPSYNFKLPPNSPLAASIAATPRHTSPSYFPEGRASMAPSPPNVCRKLYADMPTPPHPTTHVRPSPPTLTVTPPSKRTMPLYTRSVEPSPTRPMFTRDMNNDGIISPTTGTFAGLDKRNPPADFVPRLSARDLAAKLGVDRDTGDMTRVRRSSMTELQGNVPAPHFRHLSKLPSLAQIKAKISQGDDETTPNPHQRAASASPRLDRQRDMEGDWRSRRSEVTVGAGVGRLPPLRRPVPVRQDSQGSVEMLRTPTDEVSPHAKILSVERGGALRRPATPPSPTLGQGGSKDNHRLASFLRQRTSGRLALNNRPRPVSMPPLAAGSRLNLNFNNIDAFDAFRSTESSAFTDSKWKSTSPTRANFTSTTASIDISTPPNKPTALAPHTPSLISPTESTKSHGSSRSFRSSQSSSGVGSPTPASIPMITCTRAPDIIVKDGVEQDSDEESEGDVVLFEGAEWDDEPVHGHGHGHGHGQSRGAKLFKPKVDLTIAKGGRGEAARLMKEKLGLRRKSD